MNVYRFLLVLCLTLAGLLVPQTTSASAATSAAIDGGVVTPTGPGAEMTFTEPVQNAQVSFDGTIGARYSLGFTQTTLDGLFYVSVIRPDGTTHVSAAPLVGTNAELDLPVLTQTGTYTVVIDPSGSTGTTTVTLSAEVGGGVLDPSGPPTPITIDRPGQNIGFQFTGTSGQRFSLGLTRVTLNSLYYISVIRPDGTNHLSATPLAGENAELDLPILTQTGTYRIVIDPTAPGTGTVTTTLSRDVAAGTLTVDSAGISTTIDRPGQNARFTFNGVTGQPLTLALTDVTLNGIYVVTVVRPDGTTHTTRTLIGDNTVSLPTLTATGTYQVVIDPGSAATGSLTAALPTSA